MPRFLRFALPLRALGNYRLTGATLCATVEPCVMCAGAMMHARVGTLVFGALEPKTGAVRSTMQLLDQPCWNHRITVVEGVMAEESKSLMQEFFQKQRATKKGSRE